MKKSKLKNKEMKKTLMYKIHHWENPKNTDVIRSSFNRELYYKYLEVVRYGI
jgi:hypothetical protein